MTVGIYVDFRSHGAATGIQKQKEGKQWSH